MLHLVSRFAPCRLRVPLRIAVVYLTLLTVACSALGQFGPPPNPTVPQGGSNAFPSKGYGSAPFNPPLNGWSITDSSGRYVAQSYSGYANVNQPNGWNVQFVGSYSNAWFYVTAPIGAVIARYYQVNWFDGTNQLAYYAFFDVIANQGGGPPAPTGLTVTLSSATPPQPVLNWQYSGPTPSNFTAYRGTTSGGPYPSGYTNSGPPWTDTNSTQLSPGSTYYYVVTATAGGQESAYSNEASITLPPSAPTNLVATPGNAQNTLTWTAPPPSVTNYRIYWSTSATAPPTAYNSFIPPSGPPWTITGLANGTTYYYYVSAINAGGEGPLSNKASATPTGAPPAPTNLVAFGLNSAALLEWNGPPVDSNTNYNVYWSASLNGTFTKIPNVGSLVYKVNGLTNGIPYYFYVTETLFGIEGTASNTATATPYPGLFPINIVPNPPLGYLPVSMTVPDWMANTEPVDTSQAGGGPSGAISVNLAYGVSKFDSGADLVVANPVGPDISFSRIYRTAMAAGNLSSPGLSPGWTHNWDYWMVANTPGTWGTIQFVYPNGSSETITPKLDTNGNPTGQFDPVPGAPYTATGSPSVTVGNWYQITLSHGGASQEVFVPSTDGKYRLQSKTFANGSVLNFHYAQQNVPLLTSIDNIPAGGTGIPLITFTYGQDGRLWTASDPSTGHSRSYVYGNNGLSSVSYIGSSNAEWSYTYTQVGSGMYLNGATTVDPQNHSTGTSISYDTYGRASNRSDLTGNTRGIYYPTQGGNPSQGAATVTITDANSNITDQYSIQADEKGRTISSTNAAGDTTLTQYAAFNLAIPAVVMPPMGNATRVQTDSKGNPTLVTYPFGNKTAYTWIYPAWAPKGELITATEIDTNGVGANPTTYSYYTPTDSGGVLGYLKSVIYPRLEAVNYGYTAMGNLSSVADSTGTTNYNYTTFGGHGAPELYGRPYSVTSPTGSLTQFFYDSSGRLYASTDPLGNQVSQQFNLYNQTTALSLPGGLSAQFTYTVPGKPANSTSVTAQGQAPVVLQTNTFDSQSQLVSSTDANNLTNTLTLDGESDLTNLKNGNGKQMHHFTFLPASRSLSVVFGTNSNSLSLSALFNKSGNLASLSGSDNRSTSNSYQNSDPDLLLTTQTTDPLTNWNSEIDVSARDGFGRMKNVVTTAPDGLSTISHAYLYDDEGNVTDDLVSSNLSGYGLLATGGYTNDISYTYNTDNTRHTMIVSLNPTGNGAAYATYVYTYDSAKRVTAIDVNAGQGAGAGPPLAFAHYTYDADGRVVAVRTPKATTLYTYNALGQLTQLQNLSPDGYPDPNALSWAHIADPFVNGVDHTIFSTFYGITYDALGDRLSMSFSAVTTPGFQGRPTVYNNSSSNNLNNGWAAWSYDAGGRLTGEKWGGFGYTEADTTHQYDGGGNLATLRGWSHSVDQLSDRLLSTANGGSLTYNPSGEITQFRGYTATYSPFGQLSKITGTFSSGNIATNYTDSMVYDHFGRRTGLSESYGGGGGGGGGGLGAVKKRGASVMRPMANSQSDTQFFLWDGEDMIYREFIGTQLTQLDESDLNPATGTYDAGVLYLYGPTGLVMEFDTTGHSRTLLYDPQGNCVSSSNGVEYNTFTTPTGYPVFYDAYGQMVWPDLGGSLSAGSPATLNRATSQPFQYKGQFGYYTDGASSLIYCINRYYDPSTGRWTSRDPSGLDGGVNVYAYVSGNPVDYIDTDGLGQQPDQWSRMMYDAVGLFGSKQKISDDIGTSLDRTLMTMSKELPSPHLEAYRTYRHLSNGNYLAALGSFAAMVGDAGAFEFPEESFAVAPAGVLSKVLVRSENINEGLYMFKDLISGNWYIGQSKDIARRILEHMRNIEISFDPSQVLRVEVKGGKVAREIQEQLLINEHGGIKGGLLLNQRNPIGAKRQHLMPKHKP